MASDLDQAVIDAVRARASRSTVPLIVQRDAAAEVCGSGVLMRMDGKHFLLTAGHVSQALGNYDIGIPGTETGRDVWIPGNGLVRTSRRYDVAVFRFDEPAMVARLIDGWSFLSEKDMASPGSVLIGEAALLFGFPTCRSFQVRDELRSASITLVTRRIPSDPSEFGIADSFDPEVDVVFSHAPQAVLADGTDTTVPALQGISGCGVWAVTVPDRRQDDSIWCAETNSKIVAIQTSYKRGRFIRSRSLAVLARMIMGM